MTPELGLVRYKVSLKYLVIPESKEVLKRTQLMGECHKHTKDILEDVSLA